MRTSERRKYFALLAVVFIGLALVLTIYAGHRRVGEQPASRYTRVGTGDAEDEDPSAAATGRDLSQAVETAVNLAVRQAATEKHTLPGGTLEVSKADLFLLRTLAQERRQDVARKRRDAFLAKEPYFAVRERLREQARQRYGSLSEEAVPVLLETVAALQESFWETGDYDKVESLDAIYEARAILEVALEQFPERGDLLKAMVEVHMAGWPVNNGVEEDLADPLYLTRLTRSMEISDYLWRLWTVEISHKEPKTLDFQDMAYCYDLVNYSANVLPDAVERLHRHLENPDLSAPKGFKAYLAEVSGKPQVTPSQRLEAIDAALQRVASEEGQWWRYESAFTRARKDLATQGFVSKGDIFPVFVDTYYEGNDDVEPYADFRYTLWRGTSFRGPRARRERLVPISVYNETTGKRGM